MEISQAKILADWLLPEELFLKQKSRGLKLVIKTLAIFTELSKPKLLRAEFSLSPLLQEIEEPALKQKEFLQPPFQNFLGTADSNGWGGDTDEIRSLLSHFLTDEQGSALVAPMTADDVKKSF